MKNENRGFTLIELTISLAIMALMIALTVPAIGIILWEAKVRGGIGQAKQVVSACELARVKPTTMTFDTLYNKASVVYRGAYPSWTNVTVLDGILQGGIAVPLINPFDEPYLFKMTENHCEVALQLDREIEAWEGYRIESSAGSSKVVVSTAQNHHPTPAWVRQQKRFLHEESSR